MKRMIYTTYKVGKAETKPVYFLSAFYQPGDGVRALVIGEDNAVHEISPLCLSLPTDEYNKIFAE